VCVFQTNLVVTVLRQAESQRQGTSHECSQGLKAGPWEHCPAVIVEDAPAPAAAAAPAMDHLLLQHTNTRRSDVCFGEIYDKN